MADSYNDDDLLLFDIVALINAYEDGMFKQIRATEPSEEVILTAYQNPLTALQTTIELSLLASENSMEDVVNGVILEQQRYASTYKESEPEKEETKVKEQEDDIDHFYAECSFTDEKGEVTTEWWDPQEAVVRKNLNFFPDKDDPRKNDPIGYEYRKKFTNQYQTKFGAKLTDYIEKNSPTVSIGDKDYKLNVEECLNCMIDINIELTLPSLEFIFNLDQLLQQVERMLKDMLKAMDPSALYDAICAFILNFGPNFACPANLIGINLILPTLFVKYAIDLAKIRFDWTSLFGPMIKALLDFLVQAVEAVPRMVNPFIDCFINALKTIMDAIRAIVASGEKITNETITTLNHLGYAIQKVTPDSWFDPVSKDIAEEYKDVRDSLEKRIKEGRQEGLKALEEYQKDDLEDEAEDFADFLEEAIKKRKGYKEGDILNRAEAYDLLLKYLEDEDQEDLRYYMSWDADTYEKGMRQDFKEYRSKMSKAFYAAKRREKIDKKKDYFSLDFVADTKSITTPYFTKPVKPEKRLNFDAKKVLGGYKVTARDASTQKSDYSALDYAFAKYGADIKNEWRQPKDLINYRASGWVSELDNTKAFKFIEKTIIGSLIFAKQWLNEQVAKIVQTLKALQAFMGDVIESEFKVLGELQFLAHLIRFVRLIMKFANEGLNCENIRKNKKTVEEIIAANNENIYIENSTLPLVLNDEVIDPGDYIKIRHKITQKVTIIDLNECSNLNSMVKVKKDNIDSIYEGILNGLQT